MNERSMKSRLVNTLSDEYLKSLENRMLVHQDKFSLESFLEDHDLGATHISNIKAIDLVPLQTDIIVNDEFGTALKIPENDSISAEGYDWGYAHPEEFEQRANVVVLDECVYGLANSDEMTNIFPDYIIDKVENVAHNGAMDSIVSEQLAAAEAYQNTIFITADYGPDIVDVLTHISVVRLSRASMRYPHLQLWRLSKTPSYKNLDLWYGRDIRLSKDVVFDIARGKSGKRRRLLKKPHTGAPDYETWVRLGGAYS